MGFGGEMLVFDLDQIEAELNAQGAATVQFDRPFAKTFHVISPGHDDAFAPIAATDYLERLRRMCAQWGPALEVRFYAHYSDVFDARVLRELPEIASLTVNSIDEAINLEEISGLAQLKRLHIGYFDLTDKALLSRLPLDRLDALTLEESKTKALDLAPLASAQGLRSLRLFGHKKNIDAVGTLSSLEEFAFNPANGRDLGFINGLLGLKALKFVLGGTDTIADIALPLVEDLAFTMVRGLSDLGDLQHFPALRRLLMQDQQQIGHIATGAGNQALEHIWLYNCKALSELSGLGALAHLQSLRAIDTALSLDEMTLPKSLTHLNLYSGSARAEGAETAAIEALGLIADDHPDMPFFYK